MFFPSLPLVRPRRRTAVRPRAALAVAAAVLAAAAALAPSPSSAQACVGLGQASLCGTSETVTVGGAQESVNVFRGIRYAQPPTGSLRWQPPQPLSAAATFSSSAGTNPLSAAQFGNICPQMQYDSVTQTDTLAGNEDCLFLNVWTPASASAPDTLPVMVFIHGGAFISGAGSLGQYDGSYLAAAGDVVVVTLNYRLGALGFLAANTSPGFQASGNFGLLDQQAVLQWVQQNITAFGGDSSRVTIFGESAGAMSVGLHLFAAPSSRTLFQAAIMESNPMGYQYRTATQATGDGAAYLTTLCTSALRLHCSPQWYRDSATTGTIMVAQRLFDNPAALYVRLQLGGLPEALPWAPLVDGLVVTAQPYAGYSSASFPPKPFIFGVNEDEGVLFAGIAGAKLGIVVDQVYDDLIAYAFGSASQAKVLGYAVGGVYPYAEAGHQSVPPLDSAASALSELISDFAFNCGNLAAADAAYATNHAAPSAPPIFAYRFDPDTLFFNPYPSYLTTACDTTYGQICHGTEIPYVFNTIAWAQQNAPGGAHAPAARDTSLARQMAAAWTAFARNPNAAPAPGWQPYTQGDSLYYWGGPNNGTMVGGLATSANCAGLWDTIPPLNAVASSGSAGDGVARTRARGQW